MPGLQGKNIPPGRWRSNRVLPPPPVTHYSTMVCPLCGFWLHVILIELGVRIHPLCHPIRSPL